MTIREVIETALAVVGCGGAIVAGFSKFIMGFAQNTVDCSAERQAAVELVFPEFSCAAQLASN